MTEKEFKKWIEGERPAFSERIKITEVEFKKHIEKVLGVNLSGASNKQFAQKIFELRRFYFKIIVG